MPPKFPTRKPTAAAAEAIAEGNPLGVADVKRFTSCPDAKRLNGLRTEDNGSPNSPKPARRGVQSTSNLAAEIAKLSVDNEADAQDEVEDENEAVVLPPFVEPTDVLEGGALRSQRHAQTSGLYKDLPVEDAPAPQFTTRMAAEV